MTAWSPSGEGPRLALAAGRARCDRGRSRDRDGRGGAGRARRPAAGVRGPAAAPRIRPAGVAGARRDGHRRRLDEGRPGGHRPGRRASRTWAATRWPGARRAASRRRTPGLFRGRPWVIGEPVAGGDPDGSGRWRWPAGRGLLELDAETHDRLVAAISHLPLITSVALVEAVAGTARAGVADWPGAAALAASGWRDTTRLARGDVTMGTEIAVTNAAALAVRLRAYRDRIDEWIALLEAPGGPDAEAVREPPRRGTLAAGGLTWATPGSRSSSCPARRSFRATGGSACGATAWRRRWQPWRARAGSSCARRPRRTRA